MKAGLWCGCWFYFACPTVFPSTLLYSYIHFSLPVTICFRNRTFLLHLSRESHMEIRSRRFFFCLTYTDREGNGTPLQYSCLENLMDRGAWWATVHGVAKSRTRLSDFTFTFHFHALEKEMATHSSVLAWRIPGMGEPGVLPSMGSHGVGHDWSDLVAAAVRMANIKKGHK